MIYAVLSLAILGGLFGIILGIANKKFAVEVDSRVTAINEILPGANCGSCGFPGCHGYAEAIVADVAPLDACAPGGDEVRQKIAQIMGVETEETGERKVVQLLCRGGKEQAALLYDYQGITDCHSAAAVYQGPKECNYGCLGFGSCVQICPFGAIQMGEDRLPVINYDLCTGCGLCVEHCPQQVLKLSKASQLVHVRCRNKDKGKTAKNVCTVACIKCKICEKNCPEGAIVVLADAQGSVAVIDESKCTNCGLCVEKCPTKAIEKILSLAITQKQDKNISSGQKLPNCQNCDLCS